VDSLEGRTAVVTGAASGIGLGLATRFAEAGMKVVMADIEKGPLGEAAEKLRAGGTEVLAVPTDVSDGDQVDALAARAVDAFGPVHVLCNNAGVGNSKTIATLSTADWSWVLGVNLWGVIHGLRAFLPGMLAHGEAGHVVNTASMAGLFAAPTMGPYCASKFAVVAISETLQQEMAMAASQIGVSVLCPGVVSTRIHQAERNRPGRQSKIVYDPDSRFGVDAGNAGAPGNALDPAAVAEQVHAAIMEGRFYIITHPDWLGGVSKRLTAILEDRNPVILGAPDAPDRTLDSR
jgi:NAD(P)-dependent dehydrogenase (short-subunit alcohol dehydrogenase family)